MSNRINFTPACTRCGGTGLVAAASNEYGEPCDCTLARLIEDGHLEPHPREPEPWCIEKTSGWKVNDGKPWRFERPYEIKVHVEIYHYEVSTGGYYDPPEPAEDILSEIRVPARYRCWGKGAPE